MGKNASGRLFCPLVADLPSESSPDHESSEERDTHHEKVEGDLNGQDDSESGGIEVREGARPRHGQKDSCDTDDGYTGPSQK